MNEILSCESFAKMPDFVPLEADDDADELLFRAAQRAPGSSGRGGSSSSYGYAPRRQPSSPLPQPSPSAAAIRANVTAAAKVAAISTGWWP